MNNHKQCTNNHDEHIYCPDCRPAPSSTDRPIDVFEQWKYSLEFHQYDDVGKKYECPICGDEFDWGDWCEDGLRLKATDNADTPTDERTQNDPVRKPTDVDGCMLCGATFSISDGHICPSAPQEGVHDGEPSTTIRNLLRHHDDMCEPNSIDIAEVQALLNKALLAQLETLKNKRMTFLDESEDYVLVSEIDNLIQQYKEKS